MVNSKFSSFVFTVIDMAGINDDMKGKRREYDNKLECFLSELFKHQDYSPFCINTGSTSEGTVPHSFSDQDQMIVLNDILCVDKVNFDADVNTCTTFDIIVGEYENIPPGYVKVAAGYIGYIHRNDANNFLGAPIFSPRSYWYGSSTSNAPYISNEFLKHLDRKQITFFSSRIGGEVYTFQAQEGKIDGPAFSSKGQFRVSDGLTSTEFNSFEYDVVYAIPYYNSSILTEWSSRTRLYDWPSEELIHEVSTMEGFILPVGEKRSETEHIEWRISHVTSEKMLIQSFNSTQYKLYVVLKLFSKQVFTLVSKSFSSYMVKNVALWMAEINPMYHFTPGYFIDCILKSFNFIKNCLACNHLPSYIMPKKNLLAGRIFGHEKSELIFLLSCLLEEGALVIYRLPKLAECLNYVSIHPDIFSRFCIWRHCVETQMMLVKYTTLTFFDPKYLHEYLIHNQPFDIDCLLACREKHFPNVADILWKLLIPDLLEIFPCVNVSEMIGTLDKRIQFVNKCFFL